MLVYLQSWKKGILHINYVGAVLLLRAVTEKAVFSRIC